MSKFALPCPYCGTVNQASTFFLSKKTITCGDCKREIDVKDARITVGNCKNCGNVSFDVAKGTCPICKEKIAVADRASASSLEDLKTHGTPLFLCPECGCNIQASEQGGDILCPVCDHKFNGYEEIFSIIQRSKLVNSGTVSVIEYEGGGETFVWKHPIENFNFGSQLIVHESQEAIFFLNGQALDLFGPGKHSLETEKLPVISDVCNIATGSQEAFHSEVYFINKTVQMGMRWGTDQKVTFEEPSTGMLMGLGASGEMSLRVNDARKLLVELVGTKRGIAWEADGKGFAKSLVDTFRTPVQTTVRQNLATILKRDKFDIFEIDTHLIELSEALKVEVTKEFEKYGLTVSEFWIKNILLPDDDPRFIKLRQMRGAGKFANLSADTDVEIENASRKTMHAHQETELQKEEHNIRMETMRARAQAELDKIRAQAEIDIDAARGMTENELNLQRGLGEAKIMQEKGYTHKDELETEVRIEQARSIGQVGANGGGGFGMGGGSIASDVVNAGVNLAIAGQVASQAKEAMKDFSSAFNDTKTEAKETVAAPDAPANSWTCTCGTVNTGKFCSECASPRPVNTSWVCPNCKTENTGKFCSECASPRPVSANWVCPNCKTENTGKFCSECAAPRGDN